MSPAQVMSGAWDACRCADGDVSCRMVVLLIVGLTLMAGAFPGSWE